MPKTSAVIRFLKYLTLKSVSGNLYHLSNNCQKGPRGKHLRKAKYCKSWAGGSAVSCMNSYLRRSWKSQQHWQDFLYQCSLEMQSWIRLCGSDGCLVALDSLMLLARALWLALKWLVILSIRSWNLTLTSWLKWNYALPVRNSSRVSFNFFFVLQCSDFLNRRFKLAFSCV